MERERPEYLPPIERRRLEFPWLAVLAIALLALLAGGVHMLTKTQAAWAERFDRKPEMRRPSEMPVPVAVEDDRKEMLSDIRRKRAKAEAEAQRRNAERELLNENEANPQQGGNNAQQLRCVNGTLFRRIPGGWENLPGERC